VDRIVFMSQLKIESGAMTKAFIDEVKINSDQLFEFNKFSNNEFNKWKSEMGSLVDIADFLLENGESILTFWMTKVFCFEETRLTIKIPKRLSPVDSQIIAQYTYSKPELKIIKEVLQQYDLSDYGEIKAATTIFSNSLKTSSQFLSKVFNTEYKIFTNKLDSKQKKGQLIINYEAAGRIQGF